MSVVGRAPMWRSLSQWPLETALVSFDPDRGLTATGTQLGMDPCSYRADYRLACGRGFVTRSLYIEVSGDGFGRRLDLCRTEDGTWTCEASVRGRPPVTLDDPGGDAAALGDALDCDLALSPLTNLMPIRRHDLHARPGTHGLVAAFVSMPDLRVRPSAQRYEHVAPRRVRYVDCGVHAGFEAVLVLDDDGLVLEYPGLAMRVGEGEEPE